MGHEVKGIKDAFKELKEEEDDDFNIPKLLFIVIQKRVNTRFMTHDPHNPNNVANVPPGTIVDNSVVSSQNWDWYMVPAEAPAKCTATPTRFVVLVDEPEIHRDGERVLALEAFTEQLCNCYFNWPGPVRVPSCVKFADKLSQQYGSFIGPMVQRYERP